MRVSIASVGSVLPIGTHGADVLIMTTTHPLLEHLRDATDLTPVSAQNLNEFSDSLSTLSPRAWGFVSTGHPGYRFCSTPRLIGFDVRLVVLNVSSVSPKLPLIAIAFGLFDLLHSQALTVLGHAARSWVNRPITSVTSVAA